MTKENRNLWNLIIKKQSVYVTVQKFGYKDGSSIYKISAGQGLVYILVVQTWLWNLTCNLDMPTKSCKILQTNDSCYYFIVPNSFPSQRLQISSFLPAHESFILQYFLSYGPGYQLDIPPSQRQDMNTPEDLANVLNTVTGKHTYNFWLYFILPFFFGQNY